MARGQETAVTGSRPPGVDATLGLALLGMMAVHALWAFDAEGNVTWTYSLAAGRSSATVALLIGVCIALAAGRPRVRAADLRAVVPTLVTCAALTVVLGLALGLYADASVTWVVLAYVALLLVWAVPLVFLGPRTLLTLGLTVAAVVPVLSHVVRGALDGPLGENPSFAHLFTDPGGLIADLTLTGMYPALPWTAYVCVGLAVGQLPLGSRGVAARLLGTGLVTAVAAWAVSWLLLGPLGGEERLYSSAAANGMTATDVSEVLTWGPVGTTPPTTWWWLATATPRSATPLDLLHTIGVAVALLGALLLLPHLGSARARGALAVALHPLAAAGRMPLTIYSAHVLFMNSPLDVFDATTGYVVQVAVALVFAVLWDRTRGRGPLEALVGYLARGARRAVTPPPVKVEPH